MFVGACNENLSFFPLKMEILESFFCRKSKFERVFSAEKEKNEGLI